MDVDFIHRMQNSSENSDYLEQNFIWNKILNSENSEKTKIDYIKQKINKFSEDASAVYIVSHAPKYSHPDAKHPKICFHGEKLNDGYIRSGNVDLKEIDIHVDAARLPIAKFLFSKINNITVLDHLKENNKKVLLDFFTFEECFYEKIRKNFIDNLPKEDLESWDGMRQVFFPVEEGYHLLTVLFPSAIVYEKEQRRKKILFSEEAKKTKKMKKEDKYSENKFSNFPKTVNINYGGSKSQNISFLNSKIKGNMSLYLAAPPVFAKRKVFLPAKNFYKQSLETKIIYDDFARILKLGKIDYNNEKIRTAMKNYIKALFYDVADIIWRIRLFETGWTQKDYYSNLDNNQKILLDNFYIEKRTDDFFQEIIIDFSRWFALKLKELDLSISDDEIVYCKSILSDMKEVFI